MVHFCNSLLSNLPSHFLYLIRSNLLPGCPHNFLDSVSIHFGVLIRRWKVPGIGPGNRPKNSKNAAFGPLFIFIGFYTSRVAIHRKLDATSFRGVPQMIPYSAALHHLVSLRRCTAPVINPVISDANSQLSFLSFSLLKWGVRNGNDSSLLPRQMEFVSSPPEILRSIVKSTEPPGRYVEYLLNRT